MVTFGSIRLMVSLASYKPAASWLKDASASIGRSLSHIPHNTCAHISFALPIVMAWASLSLALLFVAISHAAPSTQGWRFDLKETTSGVVALESIVVSPTLVLFLDRADDDPLQVNNHSAWGALWNLETSTVTPLDLITNSFCASGALLSNGSAVRVRRSFILGPLSLSFWISSRSASVVIPATSLEIRRCCPDNRPFAFSNLVRLPRARAARFSRTLSLFISSRSAGIRRVSAFSTAAS